MALRTRNPNKPKRVAISPLRPRKPSKAFGRGTPFTCQDGPAKGFTLYLRTRGTLSVMFKGEVGFYDRGQWVGANTISTTESTR